MTRRHRKNNTTSPINFDKSQLVEKELQDKMSLWILRVIFQLDGQKDFIDNRKYFNKDYIASIKRDISKLKENNKLQRVGSLKSGHWEIINESK